MKTVLKVLGCIAALVALTGLIVWGLLKIDESYSKDEPLVADNTYSYNQYAGDEKFTKEYQTENDNEPVQEKDVQEEIMYSYSDGDDHFTFLNKDKLFVAGQKHTAFVLNNTQNIEKTLAKNAIVDMYFTLSTDTLESDIVDRVTMTKVSTVVSMDDKEYGDYCGKLVNIWDGQEEWSLFVGVPGKLYDELSQKEIRELERIIDTFKAYDSLDEVAYRICAIPNNSKLANNSDDAEMDDPLNNDIQKKENRYYTSTPNNMLDLGINGVFGTLNELNCFMDGEYVIDEPIVCPKKIYTGAEAEDMIRQYCEETGYYDFPECRAGCSWEVVEYTVNYKNCDYKDYVNVRLKGLDANNLQFRGITYPARTNDINNQTYSEGVYSRQLRAYYAIPNGCYEYCLQFGDSEEYSDIPGISSAYYHINNKKEIVETEENQDDISE